MRQKQHALNNAVHALQFFKVAVQGFFQMLRIGVLLAQQQLVAHGKAGQGRVQLVCHVGIKRTQLLLVLTHLAHQLVELLNNRVKLLGFMVTFDSGVDI